MLEAFTLEIGLQSEQQPVADFYNAVITFSNSSERSILELFCFLNKTPAKK
jgi:hypothetical protein